MTDFTADITFGFPLNQVTTEADCLIKRHDIIYYPQSHVCMISRYDIIPP